MTGLPVKNLIVAITGIGPHGSCVLTMADVDFEPYATVESLAQDMRDVVDGLWSPPQEEPVAPPAHEEPEPCEQTEEVPGDDD